VYSVVGSFNGNAPPSVFNQYNFFIVSSTKQVKQLNYIFETNSHKSLKNHQEEALLLQIYPIQLLFLCSELTADSFSIIKRLLSFEILSEQMIFNILSISTCSNSNKLLLTSP